MGWGFGLVSEMQSVTNPLGGAPDVEAPLSRAEVDARMARMEANMEAQFAALKTELAGGSAAPTATALIRSAVASLTEAPANFHQGVVFGLTTDNPNDVELHRWAPAGFVFSIIIVLMQSAVAVGLFVGTVQPSCDTSDQCTQGAFCRVESGRCYFCGKQVPLAMETMGDCTLSGTRGRTIEDAACTTYNNPGDPNFAGINSTGIATVCADPSKYETTSDVYDGNWMSRDTLLSWCDAWCEIALFRFKVSVFQRLTDSHPNF
eukprot:COSAG06_NODE_8780_length_2072_cov_31.261531_2_plen_262_part_00